MKQLLVGTAVALAMLVLPGATAYGQTSTISGVVTDTGRLVVPGASVVIKHNATGVTTSAVSNADGAFSFPGVQTGTYTVTVSLEGFKTFVANDVVLTSGTPTSVRAVLDVGGITETVTVSSSSEIIQTQAATISSTVTMNEITKLPITSRSAMDFIPFLPGVSTPGGNRQSQINGLPRGQINITLDGVNIQDNTLRSTDGFFAIVSPRLDAIEEVTLTTASQGSGDTGQGAVQVKFVTRSGSNLFTGSAYTTYRNDKFNANTWFNNRDGVDKAALTLHQPGGRVGGPIMRNKAFFFVNYEEERIPSELTRTRTIFHPRAEQGIYRYTAAGGTREVDLLALAAANGHLSSTDPTVAGLLSKIRSATGTTGSIADDTNPLTQTYRYNVERESLNRFPTFRVDYNLTDRHRISTAWHRNAYSTFPDTLNSREARFPGFPVAAGQSSTRLSWSNSVRSTLSSNFVNEARAAYSSSPVVFFKELGTASSFNRDIFSEESGFRLDFPLVTEPSAPPAPQGRNAWNLLFEDSISWLKGNHSITGGGSLTHFQTTSYNSSLVPEIDFDVVTGDPARSMFTGANFAGASNAQLTAARQMYALLTGRVSQIGGNARLENGKYVYMGNAQQDGVMREAGFFIQDSWRMKRNFTLNFGLRYELQFPFYPLNNSYSTVTFDSLCGVSGINNRNDVERACNLFQPGNMPGVTPEYLNFGKGVRAFDLDTNNWAPSVGFAWVLGQKDGFLGGLLGNDAVVRGGYSKSYSREGLTNYTTRFSNNPGLNLLNEPDRNLANANLGPLPLLLRQPERLGPGDFPSEPLYPFTGSVNDSVNRFFDGIQVPWAESVSVGLQRALGNTHAVEIRYVGTRSRDGWTTYDYNEANILETGFLDEFRAAQANLQANITAGRGANFRYYGAGTGTSPLPIYLAHFSGIPASQAGDPARYGSALFANSNFVNPLNRWNPDPFAPASEDEDEGLYGSPARRANALAAGLPANFFVANPDKLGGAVMTGNGGKTHYNALQLEFRRRLYQGLQFNTSYAFGEMYGSQRFSFRKPRLLRRDTGSPGDITHAFKLNLVYDLPFGRGRRFASNAGGLMERIVGGWSFGLTGIVRSGTLVNLGNVRLVGMTADDVWDMYKVRIDSRGDVYTLPEDVIGETIKAFDVSATSPTGYGSLGAPSGRYFAPANGPDCIEIDDGADFGDCGTGNLVVAGPRFQQFDIAVSKRVALFGRTNFEFRIEALNAFNHHNFDPANYVSTNPVGGIGGTNLTNYELDGLLGTNTSRLIQFIARFNF
jgi:hypothetical protein